LLEQSSVTSCVVLASSLVHQRVRLAEDGASG
jgi:hypothetical protein